jgi:hypothetical protein
MIFRNNTERPEKEDYKGFKSIPPPPPKDVAIVGIMLQQVEVWINKGESEFIKKHWKMISEYCNELSEKNQPPINHE